MASGYRGRGSAEGEPRTTAGAEASRQLWRGSQVGSGGGGAQ